MGVIAQIEVPYYALEAAPAPPDRFTNNGTDRAVDAAGREGNGHAGGHTDGGGGGQGAAAPKDCISVFVAG